MTVRIKDIAAKAGVSTGTVDRVIHKRGNVRADVQAKVERVMRELGYKRNLIASALATNRKWQIACLIFDPSDNYWRQIKEGIDRAQEATAHYGVRVRHYFADRFSPVMFARHAARILEDRPDAVLMAPSFLRESLDFIKSCAQLNIPVVLINSEIEVPEALCYIGQNSYQSGQLAARLLHFGINQEATALLLNLEADTQNSQHLREKERGFRDYFAKNYDKEIKIVSENITNFDDHEQLCYTIKGLLNTYPDVAGLFITNSRAFKVVGCLDRLKRNDLLVVGFDLIPENLKYLRANNIDFLINQNPVKQGYLGIMNIVNHSLLNKEVMPLQYLPLDIVVIENCDYYEQNSYALPTVV